MSDATQKMKASVEKYKNAANAVEVFIIETAASRKLELPLLASSVILELYHRLLQANGEDAACIVDSLQEITARWREAQKDNLH